MKYLALTMLLCTASLSASSAEIGTAEFFYKKKQYAKALQIYENEIAKHPSDADLLYNAGTVALRMEDYPTAMLYLSRALKYDANMEDAQVNLKILENKIGPQYIPKRQMIWQRLWQGMCSYFSSNEWLILFMYFSLALLVTFYLRKRLSDSQKKGYRSILSLLALVSLLASWSVYRVAHKSDEVVILTSKPQLYDDAELSQPSKLEVVGGQKGKLLQETKNSSKVFLPSGVRMYISSTFVERI